MITIYKGLKPFFTQIFTPLDQEADFSPAGPTPSPYIFCEMNMPVTVPSCEDTYKGDEHHSAVAKTVDEARGLIKAGFEYVCDIEGVKLFRKRK